MIIINCDLFQKEIEQNGVKCFRLWKSYSGMALRIGKLFRKILFFQFGNINPELKSLDTDCIVLFDNGIYENSVLRWLANRYKEKRLIFYYWNPVFKSISPDKIPKQFELWSYSPEDCKKYNMRYNSTFYFQSLVKDPIQICRDVFFIGKEKGRSIGLKKIEKILMDLELSSLFYVTANHPRLKQKKYKKHIPYETVLSYVNESRAVLDYYANPYAGLSLRAMESVFYRKKLITNNQTIVKYDFFNQDNVFVLGIDDFANLKNFIKNSYKEIPESIKNQYLFEQWKKRFV